MQRRRYIYLMVAAVLAFLSTTLALSGEPSGPAANPGSPTAAPAANVVPEAIKPLTLRPRFIAGQKSRFEVWTLRQTHSSITAAGRTQQINTSMEINGEVLWEVERVANDGSATCVMTIEWLTASMVLEDGAAVEVDSRKPVKAGGAGTDAENTEASIGQLLRAISGVPLRVKMAVDGSAVGVTGAELVRRKAGTGPKPPDELDFMETASDLATIVGAPPVSAIGGLGGKWDAAFSWNHEVGRLQEQMTYSLASTEEVAGIPVATVVGSAKMKLVPDLAKLQLPAGSPKPDIRFTGGSLDTQIMLDLSRGEAVGRNMVQRVGIEIRAKVGNTTMVRSIDETVQSQALRIWED